MESADSRKKLLKELGLYAYNVKLKRDKYLRTFSAILKIGKKLNVGPDGIQSDFFKILDDLS